MDREKLFKTELCRRYEETRTCPYKNGCQFAHGVEELRNRPIRHSRYKTKVCKTYSSCGFCKYGPRCHFKHVNDGPSSGDVGSSSTTRSRSLSPPPIGCTGHPTGEHSWCVLNIDKDRVLCVYCGVLEQRETIFMRYCAPLFRQCDTCNVRKSLSEFTSSNTLMCDSCDSSGKNV